MWKQFDRWMFGGYVQEKGLINKLNYTWTPIILIILSALSGIARYIEKPVVCWTPAEFRPHMVEYTNNFCRRSDSIYAMLRQDDVTDDEPDIEMIRYYFSWLRWLPIIFLLQAVLFRIPGMLLQYGESKIGFNRDKLYGLSSGYDKLSLEDRKNVGGQLARYLNQWLKNRFLSGLPIGFITILVVFIYTLYLVNVSVQLAILDKFIKHPNVTSFGTHLSHNLFERNITEEQIESPVFFRVFLCDFQIKNWQNVQHYTVQCVNNINHAYEQILVFLWIWLFFVAVVTSCSWGLKAVEIIIPFIRTRYIRHFLQSENIVIQSQSDVSRFANLFLGEDGVVVLKGIGEMSSEYLVRDAVINLWCFNYGERGVPHISNMYFKYVLPQQTILPGKQQGIQPNQSESRQFSSNKPVYGIYPRCSEASEDLAAENVPLMPLPNKDIIS